ncbi:hypothetical protein BUE65_21915, partial [Klebsiella variicola]|uniref:hypothetical protein n=1 Tax=Klebsiella variicola TaxID=244366 RepID=UPI000B6241BB
VELAAHPQRSAEAPKASDRIPGQRRYLIDDSKKGAVKAGHPTGGKGEAHHCVSTGAAQTPVTDAVNDRQLDGGAQLRHTFRTRQIYAPLQHPSQR